MAWNEPGNSGNKNPWGNGDEQGPPDLDELVKKLNKKVSGLLNKKSSDNKYSPSDDDNNNDSGNTANGFASLLVIVIVLMVIWMLSGFYTVDQGKQAVVLQLGAYKETRDAGLQWHLPFIQEYYIVNVSAIQSLNIGDTESEALMLTRDENIVNIKMTVQFRIQDPKDFLFHVKQPGSVLKQVTESAIREVIGMNDMDFIITDGRAEIAKKVQILLQKILDRYKSGLLITNFVLRDAQPPEQVQHAFDDAVKAREDKQKYINQAQTYHNEIIPKAEGQAAQQIAEAEAYSARVIARAEGEANRFNSILKQYEAAPQVTRQRLYLDAMQEVLSRSGKILVDNKGNNNNLLYLPLDRLMSHNNHTVSRTLTQPLPWGDSIGSSKISSSDRQFNSRTASDSRSRRTRERR